MRAIVIKQYGGPEQLSIAQRPVPKPTNGQVLIAVKAFGLNRAEIYFRKGAWGEVAEVSGIECVGLVEADPGGRFAAGQKVAALMGGMGRSLNGSYAEYTCVPAGNVVPIESALAWEELAAIPESYATAWTCLFGNLGLAGGQTIVIRGATSALGQAAVNIAAAAGARVIATTRNRSRFPTLEEIGADEILIEAPDLSTQIRGRHSGGVDAVLDIIGNSTILDSLAILRRDGRACLAGFLGGGAALPAFDPVFQMPSGRHLSIFASAFTYGTPEYPLAEIPFQTIVDRVADGTYRAKPARVFRFDEIQDAHRLMESNQAKGKLVVRI
jgi:NADPH:quinone reductase-like Zn-dependent oxidoreductase